MSRARRLGPRAGEAGAGAPRAGEAAAGAPRRRLPRLDRTLVGLEVFLAVGAIPAGLLMIASPSGALMHMPVSMLDRSPFPDFFWPGVILTIANGVVPLAVVWAALRRFAWAPLGHIAVGVVLVGWILVEVVMLRSFEVLHGAYLVLGVVIVGLAVWRWRYGRV